MGLCDALPHPVHVNVEPWKILMEHHDHVLGSSVGKGWNENGSTTFHNRFNRRYEPVNFLLFWWMVSTPIRPFDEQNIRLDGLSTTDQRRISSVKITGQQNTGFWGGDVKHGSTWNVASWMQREFPIVMPPRYTKVVNIP